MKTTSIPARLSAALSAAYLQTYRSESSYPDSDAERNLRGRTHYVDADTLRYFKAKVLNSGVAADGLLYWIVESVQSRPDHGGYTRRAVVFDLWGDIVNERASLAGEPEVGWFKDTGKANDSAKAFLASFDAVKHTRDKMKDKARRDITQAKQTLALLAGRKPATV